MLCESSDLELKGKNTSEKCAKFKNWGTIMIITEEPLIDVLKKLFRKTLQSLQETPLPESPFNKVGARMWSELKPLN